MKPIYTTIPIMLIKYALVNRKVNHLMLFVYFKHIASGHIKYSKDNIEAWATDINMSERWLKDALKWMVKNKWITVNSKKENYRIISYKQLCNKLNLQSNSATVYEPDDFSEFKDFCCAVVITYYLKIKILTDKKNQSVSNLVDTSTSWYFYSKGFHSLPISYLAKCLGVSDSTANNYKQRAIKTKLIEVKRNLSFIMDKKGNKLGIECLHSYKATFPELAGRIRTDGTYLRLVSADIFKSIAYTKRKRYKY